MNNQSQVDLLRYQLQKKEANAKAVPYISFILTHVALVLFLILTFFIDRIIGLTPYNLAIKISLAIIAVLFLASEWIYAIVTSTRWKKDILLLLQLEEEQRHHDEQNRLKKQEELIAAEQFRNRILQADLQRHRSQTGPQRQTYTPRSIRPEGVTSSPMNRNNPQYSLPLQNRDISQYPSQNREASQYPFRQ